MEYLNKIRNIRSVLFKAFLLNILFVIVCWAFVLTNLTQYFMWALPGFTLDDANYYILYLVGILDIAGLVLFLVPTLALTWEIVRIKRTLPQPKKKK